ncbi:hypothetical protein ZIOFF_042587 [Zingiber officinale]|uniref:WRKY domain-containing protein n=1 Tax=Zingiber officinale TaxID=94328 RepID=A0A8J5FRV5_ZINOF|nr:hypothetical protein ZIOFF_042587 [Zingiber officinale]
MRTPQQLHSTLVLSFKPKKASRKSIKKMIHYAPLGRLPLSQPRLDQTPRASSTSASQMIDFTLPPPHPLEPSNSVSATPQAISNPSTTPWFCFKTMSDVDVLDDGYKWRKYGQKLVKNTQYPRNGSNGLDPCLENLLLSEIQRRDLLCIFIFATSSMYRSYYRCTRANCRVKKRIERLPEDQRMVITTYEGRHIHSPPHDEDKEQDLAKISWFW